MTIVESYQLTAEEYETLAHLAVEQGGMSAQEIVDRIDERHGVRKHRMWVRWKDSQAQKYPSTRFPEEWPPAQEGVVETVGRPVSRSDVLAMVQSRTPGAMGILVTSDPRKLLGWQDLDTRFPIR